MEANFLLGEWLIQPGLNKMVRGDQVVSLEYRVMRVLICLARHAPEPVSRDQLLEIAWPDLHTSEHSLTTVISELRKIFEDDSREPQVIETIRKVGYRLLLQPQMLPQVAPRISIPPKPRPSKRKFGKLIFLFLTIILLLAVFWPDLPGENQDMEQPPRSRPVTSYPAGEFDAYPNPEGTALVFVWTGIEKNFDIYVKDLEGETPRRLTHEKDFDGSPVWSPDGSSVAYMGSGRNGCGIYITSLTGGDIRKVADCSFHDESAMDWSPDGRYLVFTDRASWEQPSILRMLDLTSGEVSQLTDPPKDLAGDRDPSFSPDGRSVAFVRGTLFSTAAPEISPYYGDLFILDLASRNLHQVTHENMEIPGLTWTADGGGLIFASNRDGGSYSLWSINCEGGTPQHILRGRDLVRNPILVPKTHQILYEDWDRDTTIWRLSLQHSTAAENAPLPFIESSRWESHPEYSPDGKWIAFASQRSGTTELWICDAEGKQARRITHFGGPFVSVPRWSPDGMFLAFEVRNQSQAHIYIQPTQHPAEPQKVTDASHYHLAPNWSRDGKSLYFGSNRNGNWQIWKQNLATKEAQLVTPAGGFYAHEWGDWIYFTRLNQRGIWRQKIAGGEPELLIEGTYTQDWDNWTLRPQGIYFLRRLNLVQAALCFYPFPDGPAVELTQFETHRVLDKNGISVSPDGSWVLFTKLDRLTGDIMLAEGFIPR